MTIEEAIEKLKTIYEVKARDDDKEGVCYVIESDREPLGIAIKAMEKRLPKEVVFDRVYKRCSNCGETPMYFQYSYCPYCGQKLKWSKGQDEGREMKVEDAALQLEQIYGVVSEEIKRALDVADDALGKQVAKKVVIDTPYEMCPTCGDMFLHYHYRHCPECGQKLKWREENE